MIEQCKKHRQYKAIRAPRCDCLECWKQYAWTQRDRAIKAEAELDRLPPKGK